MAFCWLPLCEVGTDHCVQLETCLALWPTPDLLNQSAWGLGVGSGLGWLILNVSISNYVML